MYMIYNVTQRVEYIYIIYSIYVDMLQIVLIFDTMHADVEPHPMTSRICWVLRSVRSWTFETRSNLLERIPEGVATDLDAEGF